MPLFQDLQIQLNGSTQDPASTLNFGAGLTTTVTDGVATVASNGAGGQALQAEVTADTTTTSTTFVPLLSQAITISGTKILATASVSASASVATRSAQFQLRIDGVVVRSFGVELTQSGVANSGSITRLLSGLTPGTHTVELYWKFTGATGNVRIRPVTASTAEQASLVVQEAF